MPIDRIPNLFIVGAQKSGTSALTAMLNYHPQVFMSYPKEPGYLAFGESGYSFTSARGNMPSASRFVVTSEANYLALFRKAGEEQVILGEASTWYFTFPGMAQRLLEFNPKAKAIVILRNPVDRAYSAWCHARRDNVEPCESFSDALAMEAKRPEPEHLVRYHEMGKYGGPLTDFCNRFSSQNLLVLFYEDLRDSADDLWTQLCQFLNVEVRDPPPKRLNNRSGNPRSRLLQALLKSQRLKSASLRILPYSFMTWLKMKVDDVNLRKFPPMEDEVRGKLKDYYREDVNTIMELTGRDLTGWLE